MEYGVHEVNICTTSALKIYISGTQADLESIKVTKTKME